MTIPGDPLVASVFESAQPRQRRVQPPRRLRAPQRANQHVHRRRPTVPATRRRHRPKRGVDLRPAQPHPLNQPWLLVRRQHRAPVMVYRLDEATDVRSHPSVAVINQQQPPRPSRRVNQVAWPARPVRHIILRASAPALPNRRQRAWRATTPLGSDPTVWGNRFSPRLPPTEWYHAHRAAQWRGAAEIAARSPLNRARFNQRAVLNPRGAEWAPQDN